jgi:hypothetical protein
MRFRQFMLLGQHEYREYSRLRRKLDLLRERWVSTTGFFDWVFCEVTFS